MTLTKEEKIERARDLVDDIIDLMDRIEPDPVIKLAAVYGLADMMKEANNMIAKVKKENKAGISEEK